MSFEDACEWLRSATKTQRKKGLDSITHHIADPVIQRKLDSKTDQNNKSWNWTKLLDLVHDAIIQNVHKLGPNDPVSKAKGLTLAYSTVLSCADARGERIRSNFVISSHFMDVIMYNQNCKYIGKDYIRIMCKHILSSPHHCSNVPAPKWMDLMIKLFEVWTSNRNLVSPSILITCIHRVAACTSVKSYFPNSQVFSYFTDFLKSEWAQHHEKSSSFTTSCINFASLYNSQVIRSGGSPDPVLQLGDLIIPLILRPNHAQLYRGSRGETMEFVCGVLEVWSILDIEERTVDLQEVIKVLQDNLLADLENSSLNFNTSDTGVEGIYYKLCSQAMLCCKTLNSEECEEPSRRRRKVTSFLDLLLGLKNRPDSVKVYLCRIGALLVKENYFEKSELKSVVSSLLTPLKETKLDVTVGDALLTLILNIIQEVDVGDLTTEIVATVQRSCLLSHEQHSLKILSHFDVKLDVSEFKKPAWSNIDFIERNLEKISVPDKRLVSWLLRGFWKEKTFSVFKITASDWKGGTPAAIGRMLADIVTNERKCSEAQLQSLLPSEAEDNHEGDIYNELQFKSDRQQQSSYPSSNSITDNAKITTGSQPLPPSVNQDLMDDIKSSVLEICLKVSTDSQNELLIMYTTVIQSLFTSLKRKGLSEALLSDLHSQFDFLIVYLKGLNLTSDLHPSILELAKVAYISLPLSWGRYLLSAMESSDAGSSGTDSEELTVSSSLWGGKENLPTGDIPSTFMSSTVPATQFMGGEEGDLTESSRADADNEKRKQIVDILVTWFQSTPGSSVEILEFLKSVTQDHLDEKPSTWAPCLLHILRQLCYLTPILPLRYVEILPEIGRRLLANNHKDEMKCCEVLQSVAVLLQHLSSEKHFSVVVDIVQNIIHTFWQLYEQNKMPPPCRVPFLKCVSHLTSSNLLSVVGDSVRPGDILLAMSQDEVPVVRLYVVKIVESVLSTSSSDRQLEMFNLFSSAFKTKCQEDSSTDISSPCRTYLLFLKSCLVTSPSLTLPVLNNIVLLAATAPSLTAKAVNSASTLLEYTTPRNLFDTFSEQLLQSWLSANELRHFPFSIFSFPALPEFYREQIGPICLTLLLKGQQSQLSQVFEILGTPPGDTIKNICPYLLGGTLPLNLSDNQDERGTFAEVYRYLESVLSDPKVIKDCLKHEIDQVVTEMVSRVSGSDSVVVRRPVYSPNLVSQCLENIRAQMKDAKKPGIFKLLALSNGGVHVVVLNLYQQFYSANNNSIKRHFLSCFQYLVELLIKDPHNCVNSAGDWSHVTCSIVTMTTHILSVHHPGGASPDAAITVQCCDMLTLLCNRPNICNILGSSITLLLRTLSLMTSSGGDLKSSSQLEIMDKVREVLSVLLKDCTSHEFLPIVRFNDEELDRRYKEYTSRPMLSTDLLQTVRNTEGAYWYLLEKKSSCDKTLPSNVTSADNVTSSGYDRMVQNTAIHTLLQSEDIEARRLLGTLDHISDLDISLINTIDHPYIRDWKEADSDEIQYCGVAVDVLKPYLLDTDPEVRRTAYRVANNILRSGTGKVFVKFCFDSELSLDDILPFAMFGVSEKAPPRSTLNSTVKLTDPTLLTTCSCDILRYLLPLATLRVEVIEKVLGPVLHDLLSSFSDYKTVLSSLFMGDVKEQPHIKHLQSVKFLSNKPIDKSGVRYNNYSWLQLDWLDMCRAAIKLCQYTTALLYLELHVEELDDSKQLSRSKTLSSDSDTQELLLEIFLNLKCSDAIYGTQCTSEASKLKIYSYQHRWYDLITYSDLTEDKGHLLTAVKHTTPSILLPTLLSSHLQITEDHYESAWRNSIWELNSTTEHGLHGNIYSSLLGIKSNSLESAALHVECAQRDSRNLNPHDHFVFIQLLNEISSAINKQARPIRSCLDYSKWEMLYKCRSVLNVVTGDNDVHVLLDCARAARRSSEFHPATRYLRQGMQLDLTPAQNLALQREQCKLEWAAGERRVALRHLDTLLDYKKSDLPDKHELLITKANWLTETNTEFPSEIMGKYLEEAVRWCEEEGNADKATLGNAHLKLALFADEQLKLQDQYFNSTEYKAEIEIMEKTKKDLELIKNASQKKQSVNKKQHSTFFMQVAQDKKKEAKRKEERVEYLLITVRNYISSLKLNSYSLENDLIVFRLCSLLFDNAHIEELCELATEEVPHIPTYKLLPPMYQLAARLGTSGHLSQLVFKLISNTAREHPYHVLPILFALKNAQLDCRYIAGSKPLPHDTRTLKSREILKSLMTDPKLGKIISDMSKLTDAYVEWANYNLKTDPNYTRLGARALKIPNTLKITKIADIDSFPLMTLDIPVRCDGNYTENLLSVVGFKSEYETPGGVNLPKVTFVLCSDGVTRKQLVKGNDDMRQDSVMEQVFNVANQLLSKCQLTQHLSMRTYKVQPLSQRSGLVEWCENTMPIGLYLVGRGREGAHAKYRPRDTKSSDVRAILKACRDKNQAKLPLEYKKQCEKFKPVFRHYFTENFSNPAEWYRQKCNYTYSLATSSIVGHIVGLGDRHVQNILIDKATSELVHIDLGVAFDQGQLLHIPEKVPFRLTRDLVDGLGISGTEGVFRRSCEHVMRVLQENKELLIAIIEVFIHDPLFNWCLNDTTTETKEQKEQETPKSDEDTAKQINNQAQRVLGSLKRKLEGIEEGVVLGVEGQINHLIRKAQDPANLSRIFVGWQAWI